MCHREAPGRGHGGDREEGGRRGLGGVLGFGAERSYLRGERAGLPRSERSCRAGGWLSFWVAGHGPGGSCPRVVSGPMPRVSCDHQEGGCGGGREALFLAVAGTSRKLSSPLFPVLHARPFPSFSRPKHFVVTCLTQRFPLSLERLQCCSSLPRNSWSP